MRDAPSIPPRKTVIAIVYWGRQGAGAALMNQLYAAMARDERFDVYASPSLQSELAPPAPPDRLIAVSTFSGAASLVMGTLALPFTAARIVRAMVAADVRAMVTVMPHLWGNALSRAAKRAGIRTILIVHDADPHPGEARPIFDWLVQREIRLSDRVVTLSNHVADRLIARGDATVGRVIRLFHPVFRFGAARSPNAHPASPARLLFFGRILPYKGVPMLLEAFARLRAAGGDYGLRVVGRGKHGADETQARRDGVTFEEGWVAPEAIAGILDAADALVLPYREASQSGVVAAAYGAGLPVVATPVGGLVEQVVDGETGAIADAATPEALAAAIRRLFETPGLYAACRVGVDAYARNHCFDRFAEALGDAVLELVGDHAGSAPSASNASSS
jgi:glycosyltransferase involved in cell wall biosynthesis